MTTNRNYRRFALSLGVGLSLIISSGCRDAEEFRSVASNQVQTGLTSIVTGLIDGVFAVIEPDATEQTE